MYLVLVSVTSLLQGRCRCTRCRIAQPLTIELVVELLNELFHLGQSLMKALVLIPLSQELWVFLHLGMLLDDFGFNLLQLQIMKSISFLYND